MIKQLIILILFPFIAASQSAFISGDERICDNEGFATVKINFLGNPPFTFVYAINGVSQPVRTTQDAMYCIETKENGIYTLTSFSDAFGQGAIIGSAIVTVVSAPTAIIHVSSDTLSVLYPQQTFVSQSLGSVIEQKWNFGDNTGDLIAYNPHHIFPVDEFGIGLSNIYETTLIIKDDMGCGDTAKYQIWVREEYYMYIPNAFTPDEDLRNDKFCIAYNAIRENEFLFKVYSSVGELIFQTTEPTTLSCERDNGWDGKHYKTQNDLPSDTYVYEIYYQDFEGWKHTNYGAITLVR
jgi:gliding motility-associated-like protein